MRDMEYVAVSNNYLEYSLDDNHAVLFTDFYLAKVPAESQHAFHVAISIKCCVTLLILLPMTET